MQNKQHPMYFLLKCLLAVSFINVKKTYNFFFKNIAKYKFIANCAELISTVFILYITQKTNLCQSYNI